MSMLIAYNDGSARTLTFDDPDGFRGGRVRARATVLSGGGVPQSSVYESYDDITVSVSAFQWTHAKRRDLARWWSWASQGGSFGIALDSTQAKETTLTNNESAGATLLEVGSVTTFVAGQLVRVCSVDGATWEDVEISTVGSSDITTEALRNAYSAGAYVRHADYYPRLITLDAQAPYGPEVGLVGSLVITAREYRAP